VDVHVHLRNPGGAHKETVTSGTAAALAGGVTAVLAMPNTRPPITDGPTLAAAARDHARGALCDVGLFLGATADNVAAVASAAQGACGLKIYVNETYGPLRVEAAARRVRDLAGGAPAGAREGQVAAAWAGGGAWSRRTHRPCQPGGRDPAHRRARRPLPVTCEVTPHHLFLTATIWQFSVAGEVRPRLPPRRTGTPCGRTWTW
jgi:carbamoyl-phosphate synthase/aspartate carbamoyltransferase/dihydroorotase